MDRPVGSWNKALTVTGQLPANWRGWRTSPQLQQRGIRAGRAKPNAQWAAGPFETQLIVAGFGRPGKAQRL